MRSVVRQKMLWQRCLCLDGEPDGVRPGATAVSGADGDAAVGAAQPPDVEVGFDHALAVLEDGARALAGDEDRIDRRAADFDRLPANHLQIVNLGSGAAVIFAALERRQDQFGRERLAFDPDPAAHAVVVAILKMGVVGGAGGVAVAARQQHVEHVPAINPVVLIRRDAVDGLDGVNRAERDHVLFGEVVPCRVGGGDERARLRGRGRQAAVRSRRADCAGNRAANRRRGCATARRSGFAGRGVPRRGWW